MRNLTLLNNVDASIQSISEPINLEQRTDWELIVESSGLDDIPNKVLNVESFLRVSLI